MVQMFYQYPVMETSWFSMNREEQAILSYQKVEQVLVAVKEGDTLLYPSLNDWSIIQFHPA